MVKKITKDLRSWYYLSNLKLANSDFRTPACIHLMLGAEVFTSILHNGQQTGPRGTLSANNTSFGWVRFGKIPSNNVVDIAKT